MSDVEADGRRQHASIVFVHSSDELYGADRILLEILSAVPKGLAATVLLPTDLPHGANPLCVELERRGYVVRHVDLPVLRRAYRTPRGVWRLVGRMRRTATVLRELAPTSVYCTTSATFLAVPSAKLARVDNVIGHVQEFWSRGDRIALSALARGCDRLIAISPAVADALPERIRIRTRVVLNATPDPGPQAGLGERDGPLRYVIASRWNSWKGHATLLSAWQDAGCPGHLTVLGAPPMSGQAVDVAALVSALTDPESVAVIGEIADISAVLVSADVVVVPSDEPEPFGLVAIEAFARGRPVIASSAGGLGDIVEEGRDGWLFPPRDVAALAARLRTLTRAEVVAAGAAARLSFESRFTVERFAYEWRLAAVGGD